MIRAELHSEGRPFVVIEQHAGANAGAWSRLQDVMSRGVIGGNKNRIETRVDVFLAELEVVREVIRTFGQKIEFGPHIRLQIQSLAADRKARERILDEVHHAAGNIEVQLKEAGFKRQLKEFQLRNLARIMRLPHGADFSVPGAGKTTVGLANFALGRASGNIERALVVAPLSAFSSWRDDSKQCIEWAPKICIHTGPDSLIPDNTDILLTNYHRVVSDYDRIRAFVSEKRTQVFLDEAHRIKGGAMKVHGRAVLDLAYAAKRRDVLTGTPAPQGAYDLVALIRFLYPGQDRQILPSSTYNEREGRSADVLSATSAAVSRYFVRTTKSQLGLPGTDFVVERTRMGELQNAIYNALVGRYLSSFQLEVVSRREFDRLGRIVMYLLEAATNPMLLTAGSDASDSAAFEHPPLELAGNERLMDLLASYNKYETPWKYDRVLALVKEAAEKGEKVLVWSNFVRNLKGLYRHLDAFNPAMIHGGVPTADGSVSVPFVTREKELDRFKHDSSCSVLLANPATLGEGVSLHHWCHHAIYVDRTFNAGQFLQSQDRIHRLGLKEGILTKYTLLLSLATVDESVDGRLREKVKALSELMGDPGLVRMALPEPDEESAEDAVIFSDDLEALKAHLDGAGLYAS